MRSPIALALAAALAGMVGCSRPYVEEPPWPAPTPVVRAPEGREKPRQSTSLWGGGSALSYSFEDRRARRVGDLVTVRVIETSEASKEATTGVARDSSVSANVSDFLGMPDHFGLPGLYHSGSSGTGDFSPKVGATTSNSFAGKGNTSRRDILRTQVTARVVSVLDDGNLVVEGRRQVRVNEETQYVYVRGIARPVDISADNTVDSVALADSQILYGGRGLLANQQRPGWMYRILDVVWPF